MTNKKDNLENSDKDDSKIKNDFEKKINKKNNESKEEEDDDKSIEVELKKEIETLRDEKLRLLAEMENLRKRLDKEKIDSIKYGSANLARDMLSPGDNLSRALNAISDEKDNAKSFTNLIDGLKMIEKEFMTVLKKHGVEKIKSLDSKFDHNYHQAMLEIETEEHDEGLVIQEIQPGFLMHDRLLRPSMVGVSKKPQKEKETKKKE